MNYDEFRTLWHAALDAAGLLPYPLWPTETIDVHQMDRVYSLYVSLGGGYGAEPFYTTARLGWNWDAALSARFATREEDLLTALLGRDGSYLVTEQPWLRVDVTLNATLPWDSPLPMPGAEAWRRWAVEVTSRIAPILPVESEEDERGLKVLSAHGDPEAELRCDPDGRLYLTGVHLSAWQSIDLPRQWDNPDREPDDWPEVELADFIERVRRALEEWEGCLAHLCSQEVAGRKGVK
jgi:hypothetical protein